VMTRAYSYVANPVCRASTTLSAVAHYGRRCGRDVRIAAKADALNAIHSAKADFRGLEFQKPFDTR
jgi:hypothetical protein